MTVKSNDKLVKKYIESIDKQIAFPKKIKKKLLFNLQNSVVCYVENHSDTTFEQLISHFGTPESVSEEYIATVDHDELQKAIRKSKFIKRVVLIGVAAILLAILVTSAVVIIRNETTKTRIVYDNVDDLDVSTVIE